ncbi:PH domain-containing protein [Microbacterium murale]|uniref:PH domain-containing protein n=1 Tax=Microbacterium murale TaxID=1081040 RepID=UPI00166EB8C8|nr:PH domain-containing protein [Microbacterium murale]
MTDSQTTPPPEPTPGAEPTQPSSTQPPVHPSPQPNIPPAPPAPPAPPVPTSAPQNPAPAAPQVSPPAPQTAAPASPVAPATPIATPPVLDEGTYEKLREPRGAGRIDLDGRWHQISPRYVVSQFLQNGILLALVIVAALILGLVLHQTWIWIPAGIISVMMIITLVILPRQARAIGFMLRADDIVFRKGILWQRIIAVPYGRMQLVDITHGPLDRAFGVSQLKMVTAAATTGVQIPGLTQAAAEALRDTLIDVAETRRTGL